MSDYPVALYLAEANGRAPPHISALPFCIRSRDPVEAVAEGHVIARK